MDAVAAGAADTAGATVAAGGGGWGGNWGGWGGNWGGWGGNWGWLAAAVVAADGSCGCDLGCSWC